MSHDTTHPYSPKNTIYDFRTEILNPTFDKIVGLEPT